MGDRKPAFKTFNSRNEPSGGDFFAGTLLAMLGSFIGAIMFVLIGLPELLCLGTTLGPLGVAAIAAVFNNRSIAYGTVGSIPFVAIAILLAFA